MAIKKKAGRISPVLMGDYDNTTVYRRLDWVKYGGTSYICKKNNTTGIAPSDPDRWQKIIDEAKLNIPNYWQMTSKNGKGTFVQVGTKWIVTVPTMTQASDAPTAYWGVKLAAETEYTIQFGISNGTNDDSVYVNVSDTQGSHYQFSNIGNGDVIKYVRIPQDAWVWMKFQHYSNTTDTYAYLILEPVTPIDKHRILFEEASTRKNISSTDNLSTILGKIKKYFSDLKTVAFTGKYTDLSDKPISLKNPKSLKFTGGVTAEYDGSTEKSIAIPTSLKNPNTLNIKFNGTSQTSYDGSATKEVNITPAGISAVNTSTVLTTKEQISANTNANNVTGALVTKSLISDISQINSNLSDRFKGGQVTGQGTSDLFAAPWEGTALLIGWVVSATRAGTPTVCIVVGGSGRAAAITEINAGSLVSFQLAENGHTIQFINPYGNVCFWNALIL